MFRLFFCNNNYGAKPAKWNSEIVKWGCGYNWLLGLALGRILVLSQIKNSNIAGEKGAISILGEQVHWDEHLKWWLSYMVDFGQVPSWGFE